MCEVNENTLSGTNNPPDKYIRLSIFFYYLAVVVGGGALGHTTHIKRPKKYKSISRLVDGGFLF